MNINIRVLAWSDPGQTNTKLLQEGVLVKAYDPKAMEKAKREMPGIVYCSYSYEPADEAEALVICTEWDEFKNLDFNKIKSLMKRPFVFDGRNIYEKRNMIRMGFEYIAIGIAIGI